MTAATDRFMMSMETIIVNDMKYGKERNEPQPLYVPPLRVTRLKGCADKHGSYCHFDLVSFLPDV